MAVEMRFNICRTHGTFLEMNVNQKTTLFLSMLFLAFVLSSCASTSSSQKEAMTTEQMSRQIESAKRVKLMNEKLLMSPISTKTAPQRDYKIGPQDLLEISVFEVEKLNKTVRVSSQGNVNLPLIGVLKVKGLTPEELEKEIRSLLAEKYLQDPHVNVLIKEFRNQQISVMGAVKNPGVFDVTGGKTILDMLAIAGGLREDAGQLLFLLRSPREEEISQKGKREFDRRPETFVIDLEGLLVEGNLKLNVSLLHGDVINVPVSGKVFVGGQVRSPGGFTRGKTMTLGQAIIQAGGLKFEARASETRLIRYSEKGTGKEVLSFDVYAIQKGKEKDPYLKDNDIIFVPSSVVKSLLGTVKDVFSASFGIGKVSVGF
jgi:polysaccharide export outer membrane protein